MVGWWWLLVVVVVVDNSRGGREEEGGGLVEGAESVAVTARDLRLQLVGCFISSPFFFLSLSLFLVVVPQFFFPRLVEEEKK